MIHKHPKLDFKRSNNQSKHDKNKTQRGVK